MPQHEGPYLKLRQNYSFPHSLKYSKHITKYELLKHFTKIKNKSTFLLRSVHTVHYYNTSMFHIYNELNQYNK